ncbi:MAG: ribonuclease P protein component [Microgenomates group bacterium]
MLKKINRGLNSKEIKNILETGRTIQTPLFGVRYQSLPPLRGDLPLIPKRAQAREIKQSRFAWIISKKISKRAVDRNKIRRRLAETIKKQSSNYNLHSMNIVFLIKKIMLEANIGEIESQVKYVFQKIGT